MRLFFTLLLGFVFLSLSAQSGLEDTGLEGFVFTAGTEFALAEAVVHIEGYPDQTTSDIGRFYFEDMAVGTVTIRVEAEGYQTLEQIITYSTAMRPLHRFYVWKELNLLEQTLSATRASAQTATTYSTIRKEALEEQNFGQDLPMLLDQMPSVTTTSDAGAGVGYTGLRIRGVDPTRINVTINSIPLNDAESHNVYWVDLPDLASSVNSIQVQRGVGTSTNGAAAFGGSINVQTDGQQMGAYADFDAIRGSFNTQSYKARAGTGLLDEHWAVDLRLSKISSDGYVDRAFSDLKSYYLSAGYYEKSTFLKFVTFAGKEKTYQSWNGVYEGELETDRTSNVYTYDNQIDNYGQDHYQLHFSQKISNKLHLNSALHYTHGEGYYEQFKEGQKFKNYPSVFGFEQIVVNNDTLARTDLIRRRWLDNDFYGLTFSLKYAPSVRSKFTLGGAANRYDGDHFGEVTWAQYAANSQIRDRYYDNRAIKDDRNVFVKSELALGKKLSAYADLQLRSIDYRWGDSSLVNAGIDSDLREVKGQVDYLFFNPKLGLTWNLKAGKQLYASLAMSQREPLRNDLIGTADRAASKFETLQDLEIGFRNNNSKIKYNSTFYFMNYDNQLVLTGELNDVGSPLHTNVKKSYRMGVEADANYALSPKFIIAANLSLSNNKIADFKELIYDYDNGGVVENNYKKTNIAFSPNIIGAASLVFKPHKSLTISSINKFVGQQFLDNTANSDRALDAYFVSNLRINYEWKPTWVKQISIGFMVNNLFDERYESNGYTYSYIADGLQTFNFYYPQAGRNFMLKIGIKN